MKNQVKTLLKIAWLATVATILLMGTNMCVSTEAACYQAGETMLFMMFWLSFPTGLLFAVAATIILEHGNVAYPSDFITAWIVLAFGGFLQWFLLVPRFFQKPDLTLLKLETSERLPSVGSPDTVSPSREVIQRAAVLEPAVVELPASVQSKAVQVVGNRTRTRRKSTKPIVAFDRAGRTPLERVIDHSQMPSEKRSDLPGVDGFPW
jgi:hypothetical protein